MSRMRKPRMRCKWCGESFDGPYARKRKYCSRACGVHAWSARHRVQWAPLIERYVLRSRHLKGIVLLVESRVLAPQDMLTAEWLHAIGRPVIVALTKVDKLRGNERREIADRTRAALGVASQVPIVPYSAETHEGRDALWGAIRDRLRT